MQNWAILARTQSIVALPALFLSISHRSLPCFRAFQHCVEPPLFSPHAIPSRAQSILALPALFLGISHLADVSQRNPTSHPVRTVCGRFRFAHDPQWQNHFRNGSACYHCSCRLEPCHRMPPRKRPAVRVAERHRLQREKILGYRARLAQDPQRQVRRFPIIGGTWAGTHDFILL